MNQTIQQDLQQAINVIFLKAETDVQLEKAWIDYVTFCSKFWNYSEANRMLICWQKPSAQFVMAYDKWKRVGRHVKKGEKGIKVLFPRVYKDADDEETVTFGIGNVFDISQTEGKPFEPAIPEVDTEKASAILQQLTERIRAKGVVIEFNEEQRRGFINKESASIGISSSYGQTAQLKTLLHEYTHYVQLKWEKQDSKKALTSMLKEVEAELTAYVLAKQLGFNTKDYSLLYVKSFAMALKDPVTIKSTLNRLNTMSKQVYAELQLENIIGGKI